VGTHQGARTKGSVDGPLRWLKITDLQPYLLPRREYLRVSAYIEQFSAPAQAYITTAPYECDPLALPSHIADITHLLHDLHQLELSLPPVLYQRHHISLSHTLEGLGRLQKNHLELIHGAPEPPQRQYVYNGKSGRPRLAIDSEVLCLLLQEGFGDASIAEMLGINLMTARRRRRELGIGRRAYTAISAEDIALVHHI
jgi:hypothetical protein